MKKDKVKAIGLMSGTSVNGVDAAIVEIDGCGINSDVSLIDYRTYPFAKDMREHIFHIMSTPQSAKILCQANFSLGRVFGDAALAIAKDSGIPISEIDIIGSHGQTICHLPLPSASYPFPTPSTMQIGESAVIACMTGITTVADFRTGDIAAGGIGAPLTPYANYILFSDKLKNRLIQNIGGIANLTLLSAGMDISDTISFDTGPGNMIIDNIMSMLSNKEKIFDINGRFAAKGTVNNCLLERLMEHPYFHKPPPKSTGREDFGFHFSSKILKEARDKKISNRDLLATVTAFTVESMARQYEQFVFPISLPDEIILCGGGVYNNTLLDMLKKRLPSIDIVSSARYNIPPCAMEAVSFAILANDTVKGIPNNIPNVTGAKTGVVLGKIIVCN